MKDQLRIEHFIQEPKPEPILEMDYIPDYGCQKHPQECYESDRIKFEKDLKEWKERNEEPEYDWVSFTYSSPHNYQKVYMSSHEKEARILDVTYTIQSLHPCNYWCDKATHDAKVKKWKDNQVVFEGWRVLEKTDSNTVFKLNNAHRYPAIVCFNEDNDGYISIMFQGSTIYNSFCDIELFKHLGRVNGF